MVKEEEEAEQEQGPGGGGEEEEEEEEEKEDVVVNRGLETHSLFLRHPLTNTHKHYTLVSLP